MAFVTTEILRIAYEVHGPANGQPVLLLHGWPDDVRTWDQIAPALAENGYRVLVPFLRGFGPTAFLSTKEMRSGQMTALAQDAIHLLDALEIDRTFVVGHDWGGRLGYVMAALWPERVQKLIVLSVGYEARMMHGEELAPPQASAYWYQWFFHTERAREALTKERRKFCHYLWETWAPSLDFSDATFATTAASWDNPDWVEITLHSYRYRWGGAPPAPRYRALEAKWSSHPEIQVPTLLLHGSEDGASLIASSEGKEHLFAGDYRREILPGLGHFAQREHPGLVAKHILQWLR